MSNTMADKAMNAASYGGAAVSVTSGLTLTEWGVIAGIVTAIVTLLANLFYQWRKDRREHELYRLELEMRRADARYAMSSACSVREPIDE